MRLRIHHGAVQVGGNCIELEWKGKRILLDLGLPLDAEPRIPAVVGLTCDDPDLLGVVLSHPHLDHYGLLPFVRPDLPVCLGQDALRLLEISAPFTPSAALPQTISSYRAGTPFDIGPFRITSFLMDHSAFDAHALLVEAGGKRLFYSGDFRGHGRKASTFERFLDHPPPAIDLLLMEGTTLGRHDEAETESDVEDRACSLMKESGGIVLVCFSAQNIDRFVSFYRASRRSGRTFVMDAYLANILSGLGLHSLPDPADSTHTRVFLPINQRRRVIETGKFELIDRFRSAKVFAQEISAAPQGFTMLFRASMIRDLTQIDIKGGSLIYSLWPGYLERDRIDLRDWASANGLAFHLVHSSGHAMPADLRRFAAALQPKRLMPIHSAHPERYAEIYPAIQRAANGEWVDV